MNISIEKVYLLSLIILVPLFSLWNLGGAPLMEWDESRNGVNAIEMCENGDYLNLNYGGVPDDWSVKPPLFIWTLVASFEIFGQNAFALRLPSALASIFSIFWIFKIVRLYRSSHFAFLVSLVLLSTRGFLGPHVGRSGDYDAMLVCLLLGGLFYFFRYIDFKFSKGIYWAALFWGLAFWVKGPAAFLFFPGLMLYVMRRGLFWEQVKNLHLWGAIFLFIGLIGSWGLAIHYHGVNFTSGIYQGSNAFQRIFLNDVVARFTDPHFDQNINEHPTDHSFVFTYLDSRFSFWVYIFYLSLLLILVKSRKSIFSFSKQLNKHPLLFLSFCLWISTSLFFTFATSKHHWYMAPVLPFIVITMIYGLYLHWPTTRYFFYPLLIFTLSWQFYQFSNTTDLPAYSENFKKVLKQKDHIFISFPLPKQDELLYLHFHASNIFYLNDLSALKNDTRAKILLINHWQIDNLKNLKQSWKQKKAVGDYLFLENSN